MKNSRQFIDLTQDIGFKIAFGNPDHPELTRGLIQALIPERDIQKVEFLNTELIPEQDGDKRMNFDVRCIDRDGNSFVCEMQKVKYDYFPDRLMSYSGDPLKRLLKRGQAYDTIRPLYMINVLDYYLDESHLDLVRTAHVKLDDNNKILSDKLNYVFLQLPAAKSLQSGQEFIEQLAFAIRNMKTFRELPEELVGTGYFNELAHVADRAYIKEEQLQLYDYMVRDEIQIKAERDYAVRVASEEAMRAGMEKGREQVASALKAMGMTTEDIVKATGLTEEAVASL
ncbi:MAG: Rpn family recombination-promoting nuclease/putative transposase [Bacteroidia bacterium]|nr:Rpn family recombination-promoting nuclease/putative transposase [Bacteroidia bacterium]